MWIANLPWCSTLNYQTWHEYIRTCVEHLLGISNEHITWWVNLMIEEYINITNCLTDLITLPFSVHIWIRWLNLSATRISWLDVMAVPARSSNCPYNPTRSKWLDLLTHSTIWVLRLTTSSPLLGPTMVCDTTHFSSLYTASVITGDGSTWTVKWLPGMLVLSWWGPGVYLAVHTPSLAGQVEVTWSQDYQTALTYC